LVRTVVTLKRQRGMGGLAWDPHFHVIKLPELWRWAEAYAEFIADRDYYFHDEWHELVFDCFVDWFNWVDVHELVHNLGYFHKDPYSRGWP
jgi:hypothetical protein